MREVQDYRKKVDELNKLTATTTSCRQFFQSGYDQGYMREYSLPGSDGLYAKFQERTGKLECYVDWDYLYPDGKTCTQDAVELFGMGDVEMPCGGVNSKSCKEFIAKYLQGATETNKMYAKKLTTRASTDHKVCFTVTSHKSFKIAECPERIRGYTIASKNFQYLVHVNGPSAKGVVYYQSPTVAQFEYLKSIGYSVGIEDDYDYNSHENDYF